jgi:hypothetical protein
VTSRFYPGRCVITHAITYAFLTLPTNPLRDLEYALVLWSAVRIHKLYEVVQEL